MGPLIVLIGRLLFSALFIVSSFKHFDGSLVPLAQGHGVPAAAFFVPLAGALALAGGLAVLTGYKARGGAWLLVLYLAPVTFFMHRFWGLADPQDALQQQIHFMKNLSLLGVAFLIAAYGAGPLSMGDGEENHREEKRLMVDETVRRAGTVPLK